MGKVILSGKGRRWVQSGHPWIYADDIHGGSGESGELLPVEDPNGNHLGWGLHSSSSRIAVRLVTRAKTQPDRGFWLERMRRAVAVRERHGFLDPDGACRLVYGDVDGFPGLVIDRYGRTAVLQSGTQAADRMRDFVVELLEECMPFPLETIVDRSDTGVRRFEKLEKRVETLKGVVSEVLVREDGIEYEVDVLGGHKTGHYLDQRENRVRAARHAAGKRVLDAFCYDGLFGIRAARAGARSVVCVDQSREAGERVMRNAERNGVLDKIRFVRANAMADLRERSEGPERFGLVIVDPPAFARNKREVSSAERGYVELNRRAMKLVEPSGMLVTASCSFNVRPETFLRYLATAGLDAGREPFLEQLAGAALDHPVLLSLPESHYLKCAFLRVEPGRSAS